MVSGQFLIDSESNIESSLARMNDGKSNDEAPETVPAMDPEMDHSQQQMPAAEPSEPMDPEMDHSEAPMEDES